jgi:hypothetical protein
MQHVILKVSTSVTMWTPRDGSVRGGISGPRKGGAQWHETIRMQIQTRRQRLCSCGNWTAVGLTADSHSADWLVGWLICRVTGLYFLCWKIDWLTHWLASWLIGCSSDGLAGWLADWIIFQTKVPRLIVLTDQRKLGGWLNVWLSGSANNYLKVGPILK